MQTLLFVILALASAGPLEKLKEKTNVVTNLKQRVVEDSLLQKCLEGSPILLESMDLPGNNRELGDPCESNSQCRNPLQCLCRSHGGKECARASCFEQGVEIPADGQPHPVNCFGSCTCLENGQVGCVDMCPQIAIDCSLGYHEVTIPAPEGECCATKGCLPDCEGSGEQCGGIAGRPCPNVNLVCVDNPLDNCDPLHGGADCIGICRCPTGPCSAVGACGTPIEGSFPCADDTLGGVTGRCIPDGDKGGCKWEIRNCPDPMAVDGKTA
jgi:hypothetical protein